MTTIPKAFASFTLLLTLCCASYAATYTVTKIADTNDGNCDADCSLREAIAAANATPDNDIVAFSTLFDSAQTIIISGGELIVGTGGTLTINGPGANLLTLDGNQASRILYVGRGATANVNALRFTRGNGAGASDSGRGGAIYTEGGITVITNSIITGNTAANGGGLNSASSTSPTPAVPGETTLMNCIVSNNQSTSSGGGMQNFSASTLRIIGSLFTGNTSTGSGGGAMQANGNVHIINSTFSGNTAQGTTAGGGIWTNGPLFIMTNSTVTGNSSAATSGGGGLNRATTNVNGFIRNSIIAGNTGTNSPDVVNSAGGLQSQGNNLIGTQGTSTGWIASDLLNTNPMLGPLADNGGFSMTHLPQAGSPAINAGQNCVLDATCSGNNPVVNVTSDQRGVARPQGVTVDIGAVEVAAAAANVSVSGRVFSQVSYIPRALVTISDGVGIVASDMTNSFGNFTLTGVPTGRSYTINVVAKGYTFAPVNVQVTGEVTGLEISASGSPLGSVKKE